MRAKLLCSVGCKEPDIVVLLHRFIEIPFAPHVDMEIGVHRHSGLSSESYQITDVHWSDSKQMFFIDVSDGCREISNLKDFMESLRHKTDEEEWICSDICELIKQLIKKNNSSG